jgi:GT2 family glycosyltransferase
MKAFFKDSEALLRNPDYELVAEDEKYFFVTAGGQRVETDRLAKILWEFLPGTADEVALRAGADVNVSGRLIREFLFLMVRAQLVNMSALPATEGTEERPNSVRSCLQAGLIPAASGTPTPGQEGVSDGAKPGEKINKEPQDLVSVIVVTLNGEEHIRQCLDSVFRLTYPNIEVLVVDNGSTDQTLPIIRQRFARVRLFALEKNLFYTGGVNYGIQQARSDYYLILNDDVELEPDSLSRMLARMKSGEDIGMVVPMLKYFHLRGFINGIGNHIRNAGWGSDNFIGFVDIGQFRDMEEVPSACVSAVLVRRRAVDEVGLIDVKYHAYYEDVDWSFRFWLGGWRILAAADAVVYHKFGAYWKTMGRKLKLAARNRLRLVLKIFQGRNKFVFIKQYLREDIRNILSLLRKREFELVRAYVKAYFELAFSLPDIFIKRKRLMKRKLKGRQETFVLMKNPECFSLLSRDNHPLLNVDAYFSYYRGELKKLNEEKA